MAAPFSGEEIIKRSLLSSILNLKFKTPKFQNWNEQSTSESSKYYHTSAIFDYDQPCSSKAALVADSKIAKIDTTDYLNYDVLLNQFQEKNTSSKTLIHSLQDNQQPYNNDNVSITSSSYPVFEYSKNSIEVYSNQSHLNDINYSKTFDNVETIALANNQEKISLSDQLAGSLLLTSPIPSESKFFDESNYPELSSPHDIYQEILHECEPMLEKNELINENQQEYIYQQNEFSQLKQQSLNKITNFSDIDFIDYTMHDDSSDINSSNKNIMNNFSIYQLSGTCQNNENSAFTIEKPLVFTDQQRLKSSYSNLNLKSREQKFDNDNTLKEHTQTQIINPNFFNHSKLCENEFSTSLRYHTTPTSILDDKEKIEQEFLDKTYFPIKKTQDFNSIVNFDQNRLSKCCNNFQLYQLYFETLNTCKSTQKDDIILPQHQKFNNSSISNEKQLTSLLAKKYELIKSAAKIIADAVLDSNDDISKELSLNKSSKLDKSNKKNSTDPQRQNQKLLSFFNSTGHLSLEELIKLLVNTIKEAGGLYQVNNDNEKTNIKASDNKHTGCKKSPEEVLQRKRQQNNEAAARYRKRQRDAKLIVEDELEALQQHNTSLKLEIKVMEDQIKLLKDQFILTENRKN